MRKLLAVLSFVVAVICCGEPRPALASANNPTLGGCIIEDAASKECKLSAHPTVIQPLVAIDLKTSTLLYGLQAVSPGVCYGVTYAPERWFASGANFCLNVGKTDAGNIVFPSGVLQFVRWGQVGMGGLCSDRFGDDNKLTCHALLMFGANIPVE
jgi:hypothetical protein